MTNEFKTIEQALRDADSITNQNIKRDFVEKHVYCNVNTLVEYVLSKADEDRDAPFTYDDILNYYTYPEYRGSYATFDGGTESEKDDEIARLKEQLIIFERDIQQYEDEETEDDSRNYKLLWHSIQTIEFDIRELESLETEAHEIFEWWAVSEYLYRKLRNYGYPVLDAGSCYVWGRTTTGQAILLDGVISRICADMQILEGQKNSWAK